MNQLNKAIELRTNKEYSKAENLFLELLENEPLNPLIHYHYAWLCDNLGNEKKAIPHYKKALKLKLAIKYRADCYLGLGSSYRLEKKFKKSIRTFNKAIQEFPNNLELKVFKTMSQFENKKSKKAYLLLLQTLIKGNSNKGIENYSNAIHHFINSNKTL